MKEVKEITVEELGKYIKNKAKKEFENSWYSDNYFDYTEDENEEYNEDFDIYRTTLEITRNGKIPLVIEYFKKYIFDNNDNIIDTKYYLYEWETKYINVKMEDLLVFKKAIKEYYRIKENIKKLVNEGKTLEELVDYLEFNYNVTNCELEEDFRYIDFNCDYCCLSVYDNSDKGIYLGETVELWNDESYEYLGTFEIKELEEKVKESGV